MKAQAPVTSRKLMNQSKNPREELGTSLFGEVVPRASVDANHSQGLHGLPPLEDAL